MTTRPEGCGWTYDIMTRTARLLTERVKARYPAKVGAVSFQPELPTQVMATFISDGNADEITVGMQLSAGADVLELRCEMLRRGTFLAEWGPVRTSPSMPDRGRRRLESDLQSFVLGLQSEIERLLSIGPYSDRYGRPLDQVADRRSD